MLELVRNNCLHAPHGCYWIVPGLLLAGSYPGGIRVVDARERLEELAGIGILQTIDLTCLDERYTNQDRVKPYAHEWICNRRKRSYVRHAIADFGVPAGSLLLKILESIDSNLRRGRPTYLHCRAGVGRTGTVVCCWLLSHGFVTGETVQAKLDWLRTYVADGFLAPASPDHGTQRDFVQKFARWQRKRFLAQSAQAEEE